MLRKISGPVESIRSITHVGHETLFRVGGESLRLKSRRMVNIHPGDRLEVVVLDLLGSTHVVRWRSSTGAEGLIANAWQGVIGFVAGTITVLHGLASTSPVLVTLGLACVGAGGVALWLRSAARQLLENPSSAQG